MFALLLVVQCLVASTIVPLPAERPGSSVCDEAANFVIQLMRDEQSSAGSPQNCTIYGQYLNEQSEIPWNIQCDCFTAGIDLDDVYTRECRLTDYSNYWVSEAAMYCNQDINLIGPTDVQFVDKTTDIFELDTWEGVAGIEIGQGQMLRKTFTVNEQDTNAVYGVVRFRSIPTGTWDAGDRLVVRVMREIDGESQQWIQEYASEITMDTAEEHKAIFSLPQAQGNRRRLQEDAHTFTVGFTLEVGGADQTYVLEMIDLGVYSRDETALICRGSVENVGSSFFPNFNQPQSGFLGPNSGFTGDSEKLTFILEWPRYYYDVIIDFSGGNGYAGFSESRTYSDDVDSIEKTYWSFGGYTIDEDPCGYEQVIGEIPWSVLNEQGAGNLELLDQWDDGTGIIDDDDTFYKFGGTLELTANEHVFTTETEPNSGASRDWRTSREHVWRVPFVIRQQRIVLVVTSFDVSPPELLLDFVGALTSYVQAETVYDLESRENRAYVTMSIKTKTRYPYMMIPGLNDDDPPRYFEAMMAPLASGVWYPPFVVFNTTNYPGIAVTANFTWVAENREQCTFISSGDISENNGRECEQDWRLEVVPLNGACYVDGLYTIEFGARCFYEKPTCLFNTNPITGEVANSVVLTLDVESTNMCPELVMDVHIEGELCDTGRLGWMRCHEFVQQYPCGNDASYCDGPPPPINAYFQNDNSYFFVEVFSNDAKIIRSQITDIWITDETEPDLFSVQLYQDSAPLELSWTNPGTNAPEAVPAVILDVQDSNHFASFYDDQGIGSTDYGNFAGFQALLDERIFPAPIDGSVDWTFTVRVEVLYEGWGNEKRRRLVDVGLPLKGGDRMMLQQPISIGMHPVTVQDCPVRESMRWVLDFHQQYSRSELVDTISSFIQSADFTIDVMITENIFQTIVMSANDGDLWARFSDVLGEKNGEFQNSALGDLRRITCLDIPEEQDPSHAEVLACANGEPCAFYEDKTLEQHLDQTTSRHFIDVAESGAGRFLLLGGWILLLCMF